MFLFFFGGLAAKAVIYFNASIYQVLINTLRLFARQARATLAMGERMCVCVCVCALHKL